MNIKFELVVEAVEALEEIYEFQEWIDESNFNELTIKVRETQGNTPNEKMGLEALASLEVIAYN